MARAAVLALIAAVAACAEGNKNGPQDAPPPRIDAAIDSNGCAVQPCSVLPQCGCGGNTACDVDQIDDDGTACRAINASGNETAACGSPLECDRGYACIGGVSFRSCKKYCDGDPDCTPPRGKCIYVVTDSNNQPIADIPKVCSSNCDPTDTSGASCPSSMKCTIFRYASADVVDCSPSGPEVQGGDCTGTGAGIEAKCAKGFQCTTLDGGTSYKCRRVCSAPGTMTGCGANTCVGFAPAVTIGGASYGVCGP